MINDIYSDMLAAYELSTDQQKRNALFEVNQQVIRHSRPFGEISIAVGKSDKDRLPASHSPY